jgi:hypothetical protein
MISDWLKMLSATFRSDGEAYLMGRYQIIYVDQKVSMFDSFDDFKLLIERDVQDFQQFLDLIHHGLLSVTKWNYR